MYPASSTPWPCSTQPPSLQHPASFKRRRVLERRQVIADQDAVIAAQHQCQVYSGNDIYSCFPTTRTVVAQGEWASFVWNSRRPELTQTNVVDVFLFRADSQRQILHFPNLQNPSDQAGLVRAQVNDSWFGSDGLRFSSRNVSYPFYWVIIRSDRRLNGDEIPQAIFTAVQTTVLDSVAAASSSSASAASRSSASLRSLASSSASGGTNGQVQHALADSSSFPRWAIAVIVVLGFLAITATCLLTFVIMRRLRRRRREETSRHSMASNSPMILDHDGMREKRGGGDDEGGGGASPLPPALAVATGAHQHQQLQLKQHSSSMHDGASTDSGGLFSGADAAIMAHAFRTTLRQPDFTGSPVEEGDSPGRGDDNGGGDGDGGDDAMVTAARHDSSALSKELAEEGRDIRSVSSSRGVRIESIPPASTEESR